MQKRILWGTIFFFLLTSGVMAQAGAQEDKMAEDKIAQVAIRTVMNQMRIPKNIEIKFIEKKPSPIPDFYSVKLIIFAPDREIPFVLYVDKNGEKIILGNLIVNEENVTRKDAGEPKARQIDMGQLEIEKSPARGPAEAQVTIVEFSNFQCPHCLNSWKRIKELMDKYPQNIRYIYKNYPLPSMKLARETSATVAAAEEVSNEAFWAVHDFFFSEAGQAFIRQENPDLKQKVEQILQENGYDVQAFENALQAEKGKKRVDEDMALGNKIPVTGTPTTIANGEFVRGPISEEFLKKYWGN